MIMRNGVLWRSREVRSLLLMSGKLSGLPDSQKFSFSDATLVSSGLFDTYLAYSRIGFISAIINWEGPGCGTVLVMVVSWKLGYQLLLSLSAPGFLHSDDPKIGCKKVDSLAQRGYTNRNSMVMLATLDISILIFQGPCQFARRFYVIATIPGFQPSAVSHQWTRRVLQDKNSALNSL